MRDAERYTITVRRVQVDGEDLYRATVAELPDLAEFANSREEVIELALEAIEELKAEAEVEGRPFPEPTPDLEEEEYSGRVTVRMPVSIHRSVAHQAQQEGVSLNSYIVEALTLTIAERIQNMSAPSTWPLHQNPQWDPRWALWMPMEVGSAGILETTAATLMTKSANTISIQQSAENTVPLNAMVETRVAPREKRIRQ